MISSTLLRSAFENYISHKYVDTPMGKLFVCNWSIRIERSSSNKTFYIGLFAFVGPHHVSGLCVARSFPMSFKSAYRLACSL